MKECPFCGAEMSHTPYSDSNDPEGKKGYMLHVFCPKCGMEDNKSIKN